MMQLHGARFLTECFSPATVLYFNSIFWNIVCTKSSHVTLYMGHFRNFVCDFIV